MTDLANGYPHPVFRLSKQGEILFANNPAKAIRTVQFSGKTMSFEDYWKLFLSNLKDEWSVAHTEVFNGETTYSFYCKLRLSDGFIDAFGTDIGEQKSHIDRLISSFQNFESAIIVEDQYRKIVTANQAFCDMFNVPVDPTILVGQDCSNSAQESKHYFRDPEGFVNRIDDILKKRNLVLNEELIMTDGRILQRDYIPLFVDGEYNGHLWKYSDITAKRNAEFRLENREKKFRGIIDNFKLGLLEVDENDVILNANESFCSMSGFSQIELKGKKASHILLDGVESEVMKEKLSNRKSGKEEVYEIKIKNRRQQERYWLISASPLLTDSGEVVGSIGIHWDITDIKALENELMKSREKAEESSRNKAQFLANMSHEIRTPLTGIIGLVEQLGKTELTQIQTQQLELINAASGTLLNVVNDVLDVSKIEAGKFHLELLPFSFQDTVGRIVNLLKVKAQEKEIFLHHSIDARIKNQYHGDAHRISQILFNIVGNAIKFTSMGGVDIHCDLHQQNEKSDFIKISIRDTGIGMDKEFIQRMFGEFEQADFTMARKYGGSGLGLHITRNLVRLMDGVLRVESEKNRGTLVEITFPLERTSETLLSTIDLPPLQTEKLKGVRLLITDDNPLNRIVLKTVLEKFEMEISEADNGQEAISEIRNNEFDIVLMDAQMPIMNGLEATSYIRENISRDIPIIGLSASALAEEVNECLNAGMDDYIIKPYTETQLLTTLIKWLGRAGCSSKIELKKLDLSRLQEYVDHKPELLLSVLQAYNSFLPNSIDRLELAIKNDNIEAIRAEIHQIRPNLENLKVNPMRISFAELTSKLKVYGLTSEVRNELSEIVHTSKIVMILIEEEIKNLSTLVAHA
ncbi:MAG: response regulator [Flavobacteriales bacterium]